MKRILITGASGFIGTELTKKLSSRDHELFLLSRDIGKLSKFADDKVKKFGIDSFKPSFLKYLDGHVKQLDAVIHLCASVSFFGSKQRLYKANVENTVNIYKWAREKGAKRFVFASSIEAMGTRGESSPASEEDMVRPVSSYGKSKLEAENALKEINKGNELETVILRIGNVYGPRGPFLILPLARAFLSRNMHFRFFSCYKNQVFQLIYIDDIVDGILKTVEENDVKGTYILAGKEAFTVEEIGQLISKKIDRGFEIGSCGQWEEGYLRLRTSIMKLLHRGDFMSFLYAGTDLGPRRMFSIKKAQDALGFSPRVSLEDGVGETLEWIKVEGLLCL